LLLAGSGPLQGQIQQLAETLGVSSRVRFLGLRTDVPDLLSAADAFVLASQWEGAPISILEAAAASRPVVATAVGGIGELVLEGRTGWLVPPRHDAALGRAMALAMGTVPEVRAEMGRAAYDRVVREFSIEAVVTRWIDLYASILSTKGSSIARESLLRMRAPVSPTPAAATSAGVERGIRQQLGFEPQAAESFRPGAGP
jgi:glycosyltransferase involved in cell wall biosynthesis